MDGIEYRWIDGAEAVEWLNPVLEHRGWVLLNESTARAMCAFKDGRIIGFVVLQMFPHAEPLYVDPQFRGQGIAEELSERICSFMREVRARGWMVIADSPFAEKLCEAQGMKRVEKPVYLAREGM